MERLMINKINEKNRKIYKKINNIEKDLNESKKVKKLIN